MAKTTPQARQPLDRVAVKVDGSLRIVKTADIDWWETDGNYMRLHVGGANHLIRMTAASIEPQLDPRVFLASTGATSSTSIASSRCSRGSPATRSSCYGTAPSCDCRAPIASAYMPVSARALTRRSNSVIPSRSEGSAVQPKIPIGRFQRYDTGINGNSSRAQTGHLLKETQSS